MIRLAEQKVPGPFTAVPPAKPSTKADVLYDIKATADAAACQAVAA